MAYPARAAMLFAAALALTLPAGAQTRDGLMGHLLRDITDVHSKIVGLAKAMPLGTYAWRPTAGVRSTGEVLAHVASDNYFLPAAMGVVAPSETGITNDSRLRPRSRNAR